MYDASRKSRWRWPVALLLALALPDLAAGQATTPARPTVAVVQAGYRNRFGHPAEEVLTLYRERGIRIVASPACGAWQWQADGELGAVRGERDAARRYWQATPEP